MIRRLRFVVALALFTTLMLLDYYVPSRLPEILAAIVIWFLCMGASHLLIVAVGINDE